MDLGHLVRVGELDPARRDRPAVSVGPDTATHHALAMAARRVSTGLRELGARSGDRVGILMKNSVDYWTSYLAITSMGAIAVRLNFRLTVDEIRYALIDSGCAIVLADAELAPRARAAAGDVKLVVRGTSATVSGPTVPWSLLSDADPAEPPVQRAADEAAMIMYTSGTTGRPKGAVWTHGGTMAFALMQAARWGFGAETVSLVTGPMYHVGALEDLCLPAVLMGGHAVALESGGFTVDRAVERVVSVGATDVLMFPFMIYELLARPDALTGLEGVGRLFTGGEPLQGWAVEELRRRVPQLELWQIYGLTEGTPIVTAAAPDELALNPRAVGRPLPMAEVSLRDADGVPQTTGPGEIWTRSPARASGYWRKPKESADTFVDGWCRTGDLGAFDEHGLLEVVGRVKDMIRSGGENIYPAELEDVLAGHEAVREIAVIGVPDAQYTEAVCAVVVLEPGRDLSLGELQAFSRDRLASYKTPKHLRVVEELPRTASGKVQKFRLREMALAKGAAR
ncbi:AMP-dependent synthetase [Prauserella sp. PE36]|uniref:Acyl--CoA ligase n=1 Tax=Prauserella endophytica TaxID=1592324 RepID=A0ABY2S242_9PSEU|nr:MULTISPECIES: class I adenylate-forming enzyme family protein [Prauserella]RBM23447.1 AMP-dependent synthetase [Prauserella sp. PE36]TKG69221.1 acyl--CoA ligase [Prauserella endophytica]